MKVANLLSILGVALGANETIWDMIPPDVSDSLTDNNLGICYGSDTNWDDYPYVVALRNANGNACCSGSILSLNPGIILTAAHCDLCTGPIQIGCNNPSNCDGESYTAASRTNNPSWNGDIANGGDVSIWTTSNPITYPGATTLTVPTTEITNVDVRVTGYGQTEAGTIPTQLQTMISTSIGQGTCQSALNGIITVTKSMYCIIAGPVGGTGNYPTMCSGDSGGPIVYNGAVYGVNSFVLIGSGGGCSSQCFCCSGYPQVGANVATYSSWINGEIAMLKAKAANETGVINI